MRKTKVSDYRIDKTNDGYRVCLIENPDIHTHLKSLKGAQSAIRYVTENKIPKKVSNYYLISLIRLSLDDEYQRKVNELLETRKQKGLKQSYVNNKNNKKKKSN